MSEQKNGWPVTSDREFSKRMFKLFMWAFLIQIVLTIAAELVLQFMSQMYGQPTTILLACIPVYSAVFLAVIAKGGVENVFKGKTEVAIKNGTNDKIANTTNG